MGEARHLNFNSKKHAADSTYTGILPWGGNYNQSTFVWSKYITPAHTGYPEPSQAVKFKQWKNTLRAVDIGFRVRKKIEGATAYTEPILTSQVQDFEILAGHYQIGSLQPVVIIQNLSNDIQSPNGINYQPQDLNFRVRVAIINQATRRPLYNKYLKVDSLALAKKAGDEAFEKVILSKVSYDGQDYTADTMHSDYYDANNHLKTKYNGIPPYDFVQLYMPPFEPNDLYMSNIGLMKAYLMVDPTDPGTGKKFGDMWSFDDTMNVRFWTMRHIPDDEQFIDDLTKYHCYPDSTNSIAAIPSVFKWVSKGAEVVDGELVSDYPLPPRDEFAPENDEVYSDFKLKSPAIKLDRGTNVPIQQWGGDEIRSYPMDMRDKRGAVLTLSVQRSTKRSSWDRGWSDAQLVGCEHRVVSSNWYSVLREPDELRIEFAKAPKNWRDGDGITNIPEENWRYHLRRGGAAPERNMSAFTLFGGGGYMVGFLESDKDSTMAPPKYTEPRTANGLRYNFYDDGIDFDFKHIYIPIPDTLINAHYDGAMYFRFRIKVHAKNNQINPTSIPDDEDPFYIDNIRMLYSGGEIIDIEMTKVSVDLPYTMLPASQATAIPIRMSISNNTDVQSPSFWVKAMIFKRSDFDALYFLKDTWVYKGDPSDEDYDEMIELFKEKNQAARDSARRILLPWESDYWGNEKIVYYRIKQLPFLRPGTSENITMPNWNARRSPPGDYVIISVVYVPGGDLEPLNDTTYSYVTTSFGPYFSYHPFPEPNNYRTAVNDVPLMPGSYGSSLSLSGYKLGGTSLGGWNPSWEVGDPSPSGSGAIAMRFELSSEDTIFGYGAYFDVANNAPDYIAYRLYEGGQLPGNQIANSYVQTNRGYDEFKDSTMWNQFVFSKLENPLVLKKGTYWVALSQLGEDRLELGASKFNMGMRCTNVYIHEPETADKNGSKSIFLNLEKKFRYLDNQKNQLNMNFFAYENGGGSGAWQPFMETVGNPGYAHLMHTGISPIDGITATYSRGTWLPLIVPIIGSYNIGKIIPVELSYFRGYTRKGVNELLWETASELQNDGFFIERKIEGKEEWSTMPVFINGHGTTNIANEYNYSDSDIEPNTTYHYRLRQVDLDGTQSCDDFSGIVTLTYSDKEGIVLEQNSPNPFSTTTTIKFTLPEKTFVRLDILDILGNVITTLAAEELSAGQHNRIWNGYDRNGKKVGAGTYIYRLRTSKETLTNKLLITN